MASSLANDRPKLPVPNDDGNDPFVSPQPASRKRYSAFDEDSFANGPGSSPRQAKRALEAHLAETDRRLDEAGKLGTALVSQRKALAEQLQEVEKLQTEGELAPELRTKLIEIEKEYNDLARESARAFLPKQRVPSNEANPGSPFVPEGRGGRRSVSPSKFESHGSGSPTKLTVPNRKIRNQPANRVHDIEFATEISTSLIAQVRNLQALLSERDEEVKDLKSSNSVLEIESENLQQRLKTLDESEHKYKEANWELETKLQDLNALQREQADREKKITQALEASTADKTTAQKELDEVKLAHAKLTEEHAASAKHHDIELGTAKRNLVLADDERSTMQRKIEDLTSQNTELAKAFATHRGRSQARDPASGMSDEDFETATDNITPEHSPPASPVKGTPRHSMLESETMRTSLHHAQRTIQSQRSQIHREKTEKLELRRVIQDLRDDLDKAKTDAGGLSSNRRSRKVDSREFKKGKALLGSFRSSRQEIFEDDPEWEDQQHLSPRASSSNLTATATQAGDSIPTDASEHFDTANEASESAFETANERATETEDFQTVNEDMGSDSDGALTETEITSRGFGRMRRPPQLPAGLAGASMRHSYDSTASTSADEEDLPELRTPTTGFGSHRSRTRLSRGPLSRTSRQASEEPTFASSPASFANSVDGTPKAGQSLFAELQDFGSDDDSLGAITPSRRSTRSLTPGSIRRPISPIPAVPPMPKVVMVDSGMMTDDVHTDSIAPSSEAENEDPSDGHRNSLLGVAGVGAGAAAAGAAAARPLSMGSYSDAGAQHDVDMEEKLAMFPVPPTTPPKAETIPVELSLSAIKMELVEPREEKRLPPTPPTLSFTPISIENVQPREEIRAIPTPPELSFTTIAIENVEPKEEERVLPTPPTLTFASIAAQDVEPREEERVVPEPLTLSLATIMSELVEPGAEPAVPAPELTLSSISGATSIAPAKYELPQPSLSLAGLLVESVEPMPEPETEVMAVPVPVPTSSAPAIELVMSQLASEGVEPVQEPEILRTREPLTYSTLSTQGVEPLKGAELTRAHDALGYSSLFTQHVEPQKGPEIARAHNVLAYSALSHQTTEPLEGPEVSRAHNVLGYSTLSTQNTEPVEGPEASKPHNALRYSTLSTQNTEPLEGPEVARAHNSLGYSAVSSQHVEPVSEPARPRPTLAISSISSENITPVVRDAPKPPALALSPITTEYVQPIEPTKNLLTPTAFGFSSIDSIETRPVTPRSPWRNAFILPRDKDSPIVIAEDETSQSAKELPGNENDDSQRTFQEISANIGSAPEKRAPVSTQDQSAQTSLTSEAIDKLFTVGARPSLGHEKKPSVGSIASAGSSGTVMIHRQPYEAAGSPLRNKTVRVDDDGSETGSVRRPDSAASGRNSIQNAPPLPSNHREIIEAARSGSSSGQPGSMGPPLWPASAMKNRPQTPIGQSRPVSHQSGRGTPTPRAVRSGSSVGYADIQPPHPKFVSRQSSVSSFASEIEDRFNMRASEMGMDPTGFGPNTDPRMIQAITQTMIGEYLWKYTRKTGRGEMSERRHRRYFWVHPYTRSLYWSDSDPSTAGKSAELKAKSVRIEAVRVVTDDNPMPPGLHRKSLIVVAPGRTVKFTCTTGQRHETWFNALSYLLMRTNDGQAEAEEIATGITREDVDEFNPQLGQQPANGTRPRAPPSLSSYNSQGTRNESPVPDMTIPTLTPSNRSSSAQRPQLGTLGRISGYWKSGGGRGLSGTFSTLRGRGPSAQNTSIYEASEVHDSAEDLREMIEQQDRESDRLENVRACCDGKHDVGVLHQHSLNKRSRSGMNPHGHPSSSANNTPMASLRSRT